MASIPCSFFSLPSLHNTTLKPHKRTFLSNANFIRPILTPKLPKLGICYKKGKLVVSCLVEGTSSDSIESNNGATIDLKLPRRSLLVHFTCNACGVRSQKLISRLAYDKGTVFVQCTGCSQYHKLIDNLNLVVEYDLREEADADQV